MPLPPPPPPPTSPEASSAELHTTFVQQTALQRRRTRLLGVAIAILLVLGTGAVIGWDAANDGPTHPDQWDPRVADLAAFVEDARDLRFDHPVEVEFLTPEEYRDIATEDPDDLDDAIIDELDRSAAELRALGVASGEIDLVEAFNQVSDAGTLAFYDPADERIRVRGTVVSIGLRVTLVHELTHALQDQAFDLEHLLSDDVDDGALTARRAVAEGDALRVESSYVLDELSDAERAAYEEEYAGELEASVEGTAGVPDFLSASFAIPYRLGASLVHLLEATDGNDGVDDLFERPPSTEEHLFDPVSYLAREESAEPSLGLDEDDVVVDGVLGSPTWFLVLAQRIDPEQAFAAALGWGGDQYAQFKRNDRTCVRAVFTGDTEADEQEMAAALDAWAAAMPGGQARSTSVGGHPTLDACDPGTEVDLGVRDISLDLLELPSAYGTLEAEVAPFVSPPEARCIAGALLEGVSLAQLSDPEQQDELVAQIEANSPAARQRCGSGDR